MLQKLSNLFHPERFQGTLKEKHYFEGWYFKCVTPSGESLAFIPGVSLNKSDSHAFLQVIEGATGETHYIRFPLQHFVSPKRAFQVSLVNNTFSAEHISLSHHRDGIELEGDVAFSERVKLPSTWKNPGIMGWFSFIPFMECYHGLVTLDATLSGSVRLNGREYDFTGGKGYVEKDWGRSFPKAWIWLQSNNFSGTIDSCFFSLAKIPWLGSVFDGFLCIVKVGDTIHRFATYTGAKIFSVKEEGRKLFIRLRDSRYDVVLAVSRSHAGVLQAPVAGVMNREIHESIDAVLDVTLIDRKEGRSYHDIGTSAGCEIVGEGLL